MHPIRFRLGLDFGGRNGRPPCIDGQSGAMESLHNALKRQEVEEVEVADRRRKNGAGGRVSATRTSPVKLGESGHFRRQTGLLGGAGADPGAEGHGNSGRASRWRPQSGRVRLDQ